MNDIFAYDAIQAGVVLLLFMVFGDFISKKLGGKIPSLLVGGLLFMFISWTGVFPANLGELAGVSPLISMCTALLIVSAGASMSFKAFARNWKIVVFAMICYVLQAALTIGIISLFYGFNLAVGGLPGGSMTCVIIQEKALALGYDDTIVLSVLNFSTRALVAALICGGYADGEGRRLLSERHMHPEMTELHSPRAKKLSFFDASGYGNLLKLFIVGLAASKAGALTGFNMYILCMICGVAAANFGFIDKHTLGDSGSERFFYYILIGTLLSGFSRATPSMFASMMLPLLIVLGTGALSTLFLAPLVGRLFGFSREMGIILSSNIMMGFPLNLMIASETAERITNDPDEQKYIKNELGTKMLIAGLSTTTSLAVFTGGILVRFMH